MMLAASMDGLFDASTAFGMQPGVLAAIDSIWIVLAFVIGSSILEWLRKRGGQKPPETPVPPRPSQQAPRPPQAPQSPNRAGSQPAGISQWEEELKRLLRGEPAAPPSPPRPPPVPPSRPAPRPQPVSARVPDRPAPAPVIQPVLIPKAEPVRTHRPPLTVSSAAYERASQLHLQVADQLKRADAYMDRPAAVIPGMRERRRSPEVERVLALFASPRTAREAVIASLILSPPKALASE